MKKNYLGILLLSILLATAQAQDLKEVVALQACQCLKDSPISLERSNSDQIKQEIQSCISGSIMDYMSEMVKELKISRDELKTEKGKKASQKFGNAVGLSLQEGCATFRDFATKIDGSSEAELDREYEGILRIKGVQVTKSGAFAIFKMESKGKIKLAINHYFDGAEGLLADELKITNIDFKVRWKKTKILNLKTHTFDVVNEIISMKAQ